MCDKNNPHQSTVTFAEGKRGQHVAMLSLSLAVHVFFALNKSTTQTKERMKEWLLL
jgi:hypothetical protein